MLGRDNFSGLLIFGELVLEFNIHFLNKHIEEILVGRGERK